MFQWLRDLTGSEGGSLLGVVSAGGFIGAIVGMLLNVKASVVLTIPEQIGAIIAGPFVAIIIIIAVLNVDRRDLLRCFALALVCGYFHAELMPQIADVLGKASKVAAPSNGPAPNQ